MRIYMEPPLPPTTSRVSARRLLLRRMLQQGGVSSQEDAVDALARDGHRVTQTTVSRDLAALGARKGDDDVYRLPDAERSGMIAELGDRMRQFVVGIEASANIVVIHTPPGSAHAVAVALDGARESGELDAALGTVAGDDTLLVISRSSSGTRLKRRLERLMEG